MDKLQPVIKNRFWILASLVIPMGLYAYFSANASLKSATDARVKAIDGVKGGVSSGNEPNNQYTESLEKINKVYAGYVDQERVKLWDEQKKRMVWPVSVANQIPDQFMGEIALNPLFTYKGEYKQIMEKLVTYAQPVMPKPKTKAEKEPAWKQKVILAAKLPSAQFGSLSITPEEMWNAQIDIWLTTLLLDAIRNLNDDKDSVTESILRRIDRLELLGGSGEPALAGGAASGSSGDSSGEGDLYMDPSASSGSGGGAAGAISSSVAFSPAQEFGLGGSAGGATDGGSANLMTEDSAGGVAAGPTAALRYIAESETAPYLERGFYMSVIIMQNKIPDFLTELTNAPWPIRIVRFQMGVNPYYTEKSTRAGASGMYDTMYDTEMETGSIGSIGSQYNYGSEMGGGTGRTAGPVYGAITTGLPEFATGALNHPELVQLDLAGAITIYKQPTELIAKLQEEAAAAQTSTADVSADTVAPMLDEAASTPETAITEKLDPASDNPALGGEPALGVEPAPFDDPAPGAEPQIGSPPADGTPPIPENTGAPDPPTAETAPLVVE